MIIIVFLLGLTIGSFLNVCIYRLPQGQSIVSPPSHCPQCNTALRAWDLFPILSWLWLRGRCRYCGAAVSERYALVELLTGLLFVLCFSVIGLSGELLKAFTLVSFLLIITFIDLDHQIILDKLLLWMAALGTGFNLWLGSPMPGWESMLAAAAAGGGVLLLIAVLTRGGMGGGDIKLMTVLGLWLGWPYILMTLLLSFLCGGLAGVLLLLFQIKKRKDHIPFGPFIALAALITLLYGLDILFWYTASFMR